MHDRGFKAPSATPREVFRSCVTFQSGARALLAQTKWLMPGVEESWLAEGVTRDEIDALFRLSDPLGEAIAVRSGGLPWSEAETVYEDDEVVVRRTNLGGVLKLRKGYASVPTPVEFPVKTPQDWERCKERLTSSPLPLEPGWLGKAELAYSSQAPLGISMAGFYGFPRSLLGDANLCLAYHDHPGMVRDMCETHCELAIRAAGEIRRAGVPIDKVGMWEDMAGKQGPIIGPSLFTQFMAPYYEEVVRAFRLAGAYHVEVDSDGNIDELIPLFVETGVTCLFPFECQAGMDIVDVRKRHPDLVIHAGIDKMALVAGNESIDQELDYKLPPLVESGGYMCAVDHRVVLGTSFAAMQHFMIRAAEMIGSG